jgi:hypothetical protein
MCVCSRFSPEIGSPPSPLGQGTSSIFHAAGLARKAALQLGQFHASLCVPSAQKAQKKLFFWQNPCHFRTRTGRFFTDFARALLCFHRLGGFARKKIRDPLSAILPFERCGGWPSGQ